MYVPFTGLGLYNGFRGNRWLKNRIEIFKQFVVPSLLAQTDQNFILWVSWRREEKNNWYVSELEHDLEKIFRGTSIEVVFTYAGVCFYDDKYPDEVARERLITALHDSTPKLFDVVGECESVLMTIQPSDDLYHKTFIEGAKKMFKHEKDLQGFGFSSGYICNYNTREVSEYNPTTNPPFYTIKFPRSTFFEPYQHAQFTALKNDSGKYKAGTPCPSHEYVPECLNYATVSNVRGFLVGTHGENISTTYIHPFKGQLVPPGNLYNFGIGDVPALKLRTSIRKKILRKLPHSVQRKLRYWFGEKLWNYCYNFLRA